MPRKILFAALLALGCESQSTSDTDTDTDTDTDADADTDLNPDDYNGQVPDAVKTLPAFTALNYDDTARGPDDLKGHPTVMWFLPYANTPG